jgi:hypothetical protein
VPKSLTLTADESRRISDLKLMIQADLGVQATRVRRETRRPSLISMPPALIVNEFCQPSDSHYLTTLRALVLRPPACPPACLGVGLTMMLRGRACVRARAGYGMHAPCARSGTRRHGGGAAGRPLAGR